MKLCPSVIVDIGILIFLFTMMAIFGGIVALKGMPERMERSRSKAHPVIGTFLIEYWMWLVVTPFEMVCMALGVTPTAVTFMSLMWHVAGGVAIALGNFTAGGWFFLLGATFDILDGRIARATGKITRVGAYYDSVIDRYGELATLLGFGYYYFMIPHWGAGLAALVGIGAMMVSYTRSKAESLNVSSKGGIMQRPERAFFIGIVTAGDCFGTCFIERGVENPVHWPVIAVLAFVALTANITAIQRIVSSVKDIGKQEREEAEKNKRPSETGAKST
jgi:CDP-diacylglycerol--glycerol-3-phosphate 3-phosphatidyltransferase